MFNRFFLTGGDTTVDRRGRFWQAGQTKEIADLMQFSQGLGVTKYRNVTSTGVGVGGTLNFSSVDFPMLRVSDMLLIYAEAATRSAANRATALTYVNQIRRRAFGKHTNTTNAQVDITDAQMTSGFILDERARELHWEGLRRSDLIRSLQPVCRERLPLALKRRRGQRSQRRCRVQAVPDSVVGPYGQPESEAKRWLLKRFTAGPALPGRQ